MKALKDAAAKALEGVESISQESPVGDHQANGDIESTVRTLKAQMRATRFALESRLGRQLAHDDPILTCIPTFAGDTIARFWKGPDGKTPWEREQGRKCAGDSLEFGERFVMKEAKERASGAVKRDWAEAHRSQVSWTARTDGCHDWYHYRRNCLWKAWASIARSRTLGSDRLARSQRSAVGLATNRCAGT